MGYLGQKSLRSIWGGWIKWPRKDGRKGSYSAPSSLYRFKPRMLGSSKMWKESQGAFSIWDQYFWQGSQLHHTEQHIQKQANHRRSIHPQVTGQRTRTLNRVKMDLHHTDIPHAQTLSGVRIGTSINHFTEKNHYFSLWSPFSVSTQENSWCPREAENSCE